MISDKGGVPRLGVPPFGHTECTHGTLNDGTILTTLFPQALTFARRSVLLMGIFFVLKSKVICVLQF